jgi:hypothetical protein
VKRRKSNQHRGVNGGLLADRSQQSLLFPRALYAYDVHVMLKFRNENGLHQNSFEVQV